MKNLRLNTLFACLTVMFVTLGFEVFSQTDYNKRKTRIYTSQGNRESNAYDYRGKTSEEILDIAKESRRYSEEELKELKNALLKDEESRRRREEFEASERAKAERLEKERIKNLAEKEKTEKIVYSFCGLILLIVLTFLIRYLIRNDKVKVLGGNIVNNFKNSYSKIKLIISNFDNNQKMVFSFLIGVVVLGVIILISSYGNYIYGIIGGSITFCFAYLLMSIKDNKDF